MVRNSILDTDVFGFIKLKFDAHTMGVSSAMGVLMECGYKVVLADEEVSDAFINLKILNNWGLFKKWLCVNSISGLGFSYRLDPDDGVNYFETLYQKILEDKIFYSDGGPLKQLFFAGLPDACKKIKERHENVIVFPGGESPLETLKKLNIPGGKIPTYLISGCPYDNMLFSFGRKVLEDRDAKINYCNKFYSYSDFGTKRDSFVKRIRFLRDNSLKVPLIRTHVGPYNSNPEQGVKEFISWVKKLADSNILDVLSIGSSQLTQSKFGKNWNDLPNGGGVPINSEHDYIRIWDAARPMLVRTYAGTNNLRKLAEMYDRCINMAWHALSLWWFNELDGRGDNTLLDNLKEHCETIKYIALSHKPFEPNVPHHFAFRGTDDISYIISTYLSAKLAKKLGIKNLIVQNMLNTPKQTWGIQDLAKSRAIVRLLNPLIDSSFQIYLQTRAGLDYFSPDLDKAKVQLAAVTALMDDIDPMNEYSPNVIHVVNYSEAVRLATPEIVIDSIKITLEALELYRDFRKKDKVENMTYNKDVIERTNALYEEALDAILFLEQNIPNLYTPEGLYRIFVDGYLPVPYLFNCRDKYPNAVGYKTLFQDGGIKVYDDKLKNVVLTKERFRCIFENSDVC